MVVRLSLYLDSQFTNGIVTWHAEWQNPRATYRFDTWRKKKKSGAAVFSTGLQKEPRGGFVYDSVINHL